MNQNTNTEDKLTIFRKNLKYLRRKFNITQTQLANILDLNSKGSISDLESGRKKSWFKRNTINNFNRIFQYFISNTFIYRHRKRR